MKMSFPVLALIVSILVLSCKSEDSSAACQTEIENKLNDINCKLDSIQKCCNVAKTPSYSCSDVKANDPNSKSGYYNILNKKGTVERVYCYMEELCNSTDGWMRVAHLDMRNSMESCPAEFKLYSASNGVRACGRRDGCSGKTFSTNDFAYGEVCGKLIGYQVGWIDGASASYGPDTVTITHGTNGNEIWTFFSGSSKTGSYTGTYSNCPCGIRDPVRPVKELESDSYYCEAGSQNAPEAGRFYPEERLWDGENCGPVETDCCKHPDMPWFYKPLGYSTTDYIEIEICCTEGTGDEDIPLEQYEIYVK